MDLDTFLRTRRPGWKRLEELLLRAEGAGPASLEQGEVVEFGQLYRRAASDLNQAQTFPFGDQAVSYLNDLAARCYRMIHGRPSRVRVWRLFTDYPAVFRRCLPQVLLATAFLLAGVLCGALAGWFDAAAARAFLLPADMPTIQPSREGQPDDTPLISTGELAAFSSHLFTNNLRVSLFAFALGMTFGVGTAWLLFYNGVLLGALGTVFAEAGQLRALATGILPHGVLEIPAAVIGGAAGFILAEALLRVRPWPRTEELGARAGEAVRLVSGCVPLLAAAAFLEAGVARAPDAFLASGWKLLIAAAVGTAFVTWLILGGRQKPGERDIA